MKKLLSVIGLCLVLISVGAFSWFNKEFPKYITYECGSGDSKEIVVRESDDLIRNKTTGRNAYNMDFNRQGFDSVIVYMLWDSITGEGYMYKKDTKELEQMNPNQLCKYVSSERHKE